MFVLLKTFLIVRVFATVAAITVSLWLAGKAVRRFEHLSYDVKGIVVANLLSLPGAIGFMFMIAGMSQNLFETVSATPLLIATASSLISIISTVYLIFMLDEDEPTGKKINSVGA